MESNEFTFVWSICKFSERPEKMGQFFPSQQFVINGPDDKMWRILDYLEERVPENRNSFSILDVKKTKITQVVEKGTFKFPQ